MSVRPNKWMSLWCLTPLSTIFQLYRDHYFVCHSSSVYPFGIFKLFVSRGHEQVNTEMYIWCLEPQNNLKPRNIHQMYIYVFNLFGDSRHEMHISVFNLIRGSRHQMYISVLNLFSGSRYQMYISVYNLFRGSINTRYTFMYFTSSGVPS
jgi:hypothetical protein